MFEVMQAARQVPRVLYTYVRVFVCLTQEDLVPLYNREDLFQSLQRAYRQEARKIWDRLLPRAVSGVDLTSSQQAVVSILSHIQGLTVEF